MSGPGPGRPGPVALLARSKTSGRMNELIDGWKDGSMNK